MFQYIQKIRAMRRDPFPPISMKEAEFRALCRGAPIWHSVDLGEGWIEGARKTSEVLAEELSFADLPDLSGKTVLDIGAFGGFFSFEAARRGGKVTAIDYYSWVTDFPALHKWLSDERAKGHQPDNYAPPAYITDVNGAPGRTPFDIVNRALGNPVEAVTTTLENYRPREAFDVTLYLGVLYHMRDPIGAVQRLSVSDAQSGRHRNLGDARAGAAGRTLLGVPWWRGCQQGCDHSLVAKRQGP